MEPIVTPTTEAVTPQKEPGTFSSAKDEMRARHKVNNELAQLNDRYHKRIPTDRIALILNKNGFDPYWIETQRYWGDQGRIHIQVGSNSYLTLTWHRFVETTLNYEIVVYVS